MFCCALSIWNRPKELRINRQLLIPKKGLIYDHLYLKRHYTAWDSWAVFVNKIDIAERAKVLFNYCNNHVQEGFRCRWITVYWYEEFSVRVYGVFETCLLTTRARVLEVLCVDL